MSLLLGGSGCFAGGWLVIATLPGSPVLAMVAMGMSGFFNDLSMSGAWGARMDVGGKSAGTLSGSMDMMGNLGGVLGPFVTPYILEASGHNWNVVIWVAAGTYLVSALCWVFIDPVTPID